jgi:secernin
MLARMAKRKFRMKHVYRRIGLGFLACLAGLAGLADVKACDTWVALANATAARLTILAKNSDRPRFDAQPLLFYPRRSWPAGAMVDLGRIKIPQLKETFATMGSSPYWCWGYEEGINEFGVAIGNEGESTKTLEDGVAASKKGNGPALGPTGMDLLRLGLERGRTAREALEVISRLVEKYGQFGSGHPTQGVDGSYDNSFLIADPGEAWVLETVGTRWIAKRFVQGATSISNKLSITTAWNRASPDLVDYAVQRGWWPQNQKAQFNFEIAYSGETPEHQLGHQRALTRASCSARLLQEKAGQVTLRWMMRVARDRSTSPSLDNSSTASSCVAVLPASAEDLPVFWWSASRPGNGCFVPYFVHGSRLPEILSQAGTFGRRIVPPDLAQPDAFSANSYWWLSKDLSDKVDAEWAVRNPLVRSEFDVLENEFEAGIPALVKRATALRKAGQAGAAAALLDQYSASCLEKTVKKIQELRRRFENAASGPSR